MVVLCFFKNYKTISYRKVTGTEEVAWVLNPSGMNQIYEANFVLETKCEDHPNLVSDISSLFIRIISFLDCHEAEDQVLESLYVKICINLHV